MGSRGRYCALDGIRSYSILGIIVMHVAANGGYAVQGFWYQELIPSFTNLVFLFMMVSGFGMCCGYFVKITEQRITLEEFYNKRYIKIWPFFTLLCLFDLIMSLSKESVYETFANLTLCAGLLPNADIKVIGVSWTLSVIFVFYLLFPFFCYLLQSKTRAWVALGVAFIFNVLCDVYFFDSQHMLADFSSRRSFIYCAIYFFVGGVIYLYREFIVKVIKKHKIFVALMCIGSAVLYFMWGENTITILLFSALLLIYAMIVEQKGILINKFTKSISEISFEMYLSHMLIFRFLEKLNLIHIHENDIVSYVFATAITMIGTIVFSKSAQCILRKAWSFYKSMKFRKVNERRI